MSDATNEPSALRAAILPGEQLLQSARVVAEEHDAVVWRLGYSVWLKKLHEAVSVERGERHAEAFARALHMPGPGGGWRSRFDAEVRSVEAALAGLRRLLEER